jgi:hypothetical protein
MTKEMTSSRDQGASLLWGIFFKSVMLGFYVGLSEGSGT